MNEQEVDRAAREWAEDDPFVEVPAFKAGAAWQMERDRRAWLSLLSELLRTADDAEDVRVIMKAMELVRENGLRGLTG